MSGPVVLNLVTVLHAVEQSSRASKPHDSKPGEPYFPALRGPTRWAVANSRGP